MDLTVLGCQAGMPDGGRASSGYLVTTDGCRLLLDCGPGVATALSDAGGLSGAAGLDAIVISHLHPDHCYDLLPIGTTRRRATGSAPLPVFAPRGAGALMRDLAGVFPLRSGPGPVSPFHDAFAVVEYDPGAVFEVGDCTLTMHGLRHTVANCGIRVEHGSGTLAYTGDTGRTEALLPLADGADLLLAEATLAEAETGDYGHLCAADAARVAADASVGRLVLTHLGSADPGWAQARADEAAAIFTGPIHLAQPGGRYQVRP